MAIEHSVVALVFAAIFLFGGALHVIKSQRAALSFSAGVSTAYVFVHMLPEMAEAGRVFVDETSGRALPLPELRIYTSALAGFIVFYGLNTLSGWSREQAAEGGGEPAGPSRAFALQVIGFALYVWLVTYLMVRGIEETAVPTALYAVAMGVHFLGIDHSLFREHGNAYKRWGRFVLAAAALAGPLSATWLVIPEPILITGLGLVSGGVVMNSMIMELPSEKDGRFWPFLGGAVAYTTLLALIR